MTRVFNRLLSLLWRNLGWCVGLVLVSTWVVGCEVRQRPQNVILVSVDTLRPDALGAYGRAYAKTPNLDALAEAGVTFTRAYAPMPRTTPSLASMLTGLSPHRHGSREVRSPVVSGTFLTTPLKESGFATVAVTANPTAGKNQGFATDFDSFEESMRFDAEEVTNRVLRTVRDIPATKPLFVWAHYYDPHWPYAAPAAWRSPTEDACDALTKLDRGVKQSNEGNLAQNAMESCQAAYASEVAYVDRQIGRLFDALAAAGRLDDSLVVFTSDHGENFGEDGLYFAHGPSVHEAGLRVPLIVSGPGVRRGHTDDSVIRLIDVGPTVLAALGLDPIPDVDGSPRTDLLDAGALGRLKRWWRGPAEGEQVLSFAESGGALLVKDHTSLLAGRPRTGYCLNDGEYSLCWKDDTEGALFHRRLDPALEHDLQQEQPERFATMSEARRRWKPGSTRMRSVTDGRFKLIERPRLAGGYSLTLVDFVTDPTETVPVGDEHPDLFQHFSSVLHAWTRNTAGYVQEELSDIEEAQLRALGYVE